MIKKRRLISFILALLFLVTGATCSSTQPSENRTAGDVLTIPMIEKLAHINPLITSTTLSASLSEIIFDGLISLNERFEPQNQLVLSYERSEDGRTWTFHLRSGVRFHDGSELTAEDVVFTYQQLRAHNLKPMGTYVYEHITNIAVKDKYIFSITFKKPLSSFLQELQIGILPKHFLEGEDLTKTPFNQHPVGTGPFVLRSWSDKEITLVANDNYFLGRPYLDQIRITVYPNREASWAKLVAGEADFFPYISPSSSEMLRQVPSVNLYTIPMPHYYFIAFNINKGFFNDQRVRQALNFAINKKEIVSKILKGQGQEAAGTIFPGSWAYNPNIKSYPYDPQKALILLKEAGWEDHDGDHFLDKDGKRFEFMVHVNTGDDLKQKALLLIQQHLLDIGIRMKVRLFEAAEAGFLFNRNFDAHFPEIDAGGDPDLSYKHWHSSQIENGVNVSSYRNPVVDQLLEKGRMEFNREKRKEIYFRYQEEILNDPPGIFLFWTNYLVGVHKRFKGVEISPVGPFSNIREWYVPKAEQKYTKSGSLNE